MVSHILIRNSLNSADIRYLCGAEPPETVVLILSGRTKKMIVSYLE